MPTDAKAAAGLVNQAMTALRRLAGVPGVRADIDQVADDFERIWEREPMIAATVGTDAPGRTSFLNEAIGSALLDPELKRPPELTVRVVAADKTRCTAHHFDGTVEEFGPADTDPAVVQVAAAKNERLEETQTQVESRRSQLELRKMALPPVLREPPPRWAFWLWLWRWILGFFYGKERQAIRDAEKAVATSKEQLLAMHSNDRPPAPRDFAQRIRDLSDADSRGAGVDRLTLEIAGSRLSDGVAVDDVPVPAFERMRDRIDGWFWIGDVGAEPGASAAPRGLRRLYVVGSTKPPYAAENLTFRRAGDSRHAVESIARLLAVERALHIAARASRELRVAVATLEDSLQQHEARFAERIASLKSRRIDNPDKFVNRQLERLHPMVVAQVHGLLQTEAEWAKQRLDSLSAAWRALIQEAESSDDIRATLTDIEDSAPERLRVASDEILSRLRKGLRVSVAALHEKALVELRKISPPAESAIPLVPSPPEIGLSIANRPPDSLGTGPGWLASLFKSKKKLRAEICERIEERGGKLRDLTVSDLLDTEPTIGRLLADFAKASLMNAVREHERWLSRALIDEQKAIERERAELEPSRQSRDVARADADRLDALHTQTEAALPPLLKA